MERISEGDVVVLEKIYNQPGRVEVFKVKQIRTGKILIMKKVYVKDIQEATMMQSECIAMASLNHDNIVKLIAASLGGQEKTITHLLIFSEYCQEGDLENFIKRCASANQYLPEDLLLNYLKMLVNAFIYMQDKNVAHRDIKPQNIFVCENGAKLKVGDLGSASQQDDRKVSTIVGTPLYLSPLLRKAYSKSVQFGGVEHDVYKSDVYSLGLTFLYLASLRPVSDLINLADMELKTQQRISQLSHMYPTLSKILERMLMDDEFYRVEFIDIRKSLNKGHKVSEVLDIESYGRVCKEKGIVEISNLKCIVCEITQNEDDFFVFNAGLLCKTCKAQYASRRELQSL